MSDALPPNPGFEADVRRAVEAQPFLSFVDARLESIEPGYVEIAVAFRPEIGDDEGGFHSGLCAALADVAGAAAALTLMPAERRARTIEFKANALAPARGVRLIARGEAIRANETLATCQTDLYGVDENGAEALIATSLGTFMAV